MKNYEKLTFAFALLIVVISITYDQKRLASSKEIYLKDSISGIWTATIQSISALEAPITQKIVLSKNQKSLGGSVQNNKILEGNITNNKIQFKTKNLLENGTLETWEAGMENGKLIGKIKSGHHIREWRAEKNTIR